MELKRKQLKNISLRWFYFESNEKALNIYELLVNTATEYVLKSTNIKGKIE